jgi:diguanylate cyclase (GGDEF)-like protein
MKLFPPDDNKQVMRLRRTILAQAAGVIHGLLCLIAFWLGAFRESWQVLAGLLLVAWAGHTLMALFIRSGLNKRLKDPGLTIAQITWATAMVMVSIYFLDQLRMVVLMYYVLVLFFGAFALLPRGFVFVTAQAMVGYGLVLWFLAQYHPEVIDLKIELVNWLGFTISMGAFSLVAADLSRLRRRVSLQNRDLREALATIQELAVTDELTGLHNRRHVLGVLEYQKGLADRGNHSFVLAFADLDHFKQVNDQWGHQAGDEVLKRFAQIARNTIRSVDYIARFGGEEFILVLVQTGLPVAMKAAERIRDKTENENFEFGGAGSINITVSFGVTQYEPGESVDAVLARADQALYKAKQKGRNRLESIPPVPSLAGHDNLSLFHTRS